MRTNIFLCFFLIVLNSNLYPQLTTVEKNNFEIITGCNTNTHNNIKTTIDSTFIYKLHFGELKKLEFLKTEIRTYNNYGLPEIKNNFFSFQEGVESTYYVYDISCITEINYDNQGVNILSMKAHSNNSYLSAVGDFIIKLKYINDRVVQKDVYCLNGRCDEGDLINSYTYDYDNLGRIIQCNNLNKKLVTNYSYGKNGLLEKVYRYRINTEIGNHIPKQLPRYKRIINYDNFGRVTSNLAFINNCEYDLFFSGYKKILKENLDDIETKWRKIEDTKDEHGNELGYFDYSSEKANWSLRKTFNMVNGNKVYSKMTTRKYQTFEEYEFFLEIERKNETKRKLKAELEKKKKLEKEKKRIIELTKEHQEQERKTAENKSILEFRNSDYGRLQNAIKNEFTVWLEKGKSENQKEYEKRVKSNYQLVFDKIVQNQTDKSKRNSNKVLSGSLLTYDAVSEQFEVKIVGGDNNVMQSPEILIKIPSNLAQNLKNRYSHKTVRRGKPLLIHILDFKMSNNNWIPSHILILFSNNGYESHYWNYTNIIVNRKGKYQLTYGEKINLSDINLKNIDTQFKKSSLDFGLYYYEWILNSSEIVTMDINFTIDEIGIKLPF